MNATVRDVSIRAANRRFRLSSDFALDFPTIKTGRVMNRLNRVRKVNCELFGSALRCGLIDRATNLREVKLIILASDRDDLAALPSFERGRGSVTVRFDARNALDASEYEIRWRIYRAGLLGLAAVARQVQAGQDVMKALASAHGASPAERYPAFIGASQDDSELFYRYETFAKGDRQ